jgi:hypothetical protein
MGEQLLKVVAMCCNNEPDVVELVNEEGELKANCTNWNCFVCSQRDTTLEAHFHLLNDNGDHLVLSLNDRLKFLSDHQWESFPDLYEFLNEWFEQEHHALSLFSNRDFMEIIWDSYNLNNEGNFKEGRPNPNPRKAAKKKYKGTVWVLEELNMDLNVSKPKKKEVVYFFELLEEELEDFKNQFRAGELFEGKLVLRVTVD